MATVRLRRGRSVVVGNYRILNETPHEVKLLIDREDGLPLTDGELCYRPRILPPKMERYRPPKDE